MARYKYKLDTDKLSVSYKILVLVVGILFMASIITGIGAIISIAISSQITNYWCIVCFFISLFYVILRAISKPLIFDTDDEIKKEFRKITKDEKETIC